MLLIFNRNIGNNRTRKFKSSGISEDRKGISKKGKS